MTKDSLPWKALVGKDEATLRRNRTRKWQDFSHYSREQIGLWTVARIASKFST